MSSASSSPTSAPSTNNPDLGLTSSKRSSSFVATKVRDEGRKLREERKMPTVVTPSWAHFVAGGLGGMLGALVTCPLEVVKTRLQAKGNKENLVSKFRFGLGTYNALKELFYTEGIGGLYRGLGPNLVGVIPARAIYFFGLGSSKQVLVNQFGFDPERSTTSFVSGVIAGVAVTTTTQPIWLVKTRMQLQSRQQQILYNNSFDAVRKIYKNEGLRAFYIGMSASYLGITESCLQFVLYERFKLIVHKNKLKRSEESEDRFTPTKLTPVEYVFTSSIAKLIAAAASYPHEVIRTRLREPGNNKYKGLISGLTMIAREEGIRGLYGGMGAHLVRVVPNSAIMFLTYELVTQALSWTEPPESINPNDEITS